MPYDLGQLSRVSKWGYVDVDYDHNYAPDCNCDYMHRCSTITNIRVTPHPAKLAKLVVTPSDNPLLDYCMERVVASSPEIRNPKNWHVPVVYGYYGEEACDPQWDCNSIGLFSTLRELENASSSKEMMEIALTAEYGYVLSSVQDCSSWGIEEVPCALIRTFNNEYGRRLDPELVDLYRDMMKDNPVVAVVLQLNPEPSYRLIDGYHRYAAANRLDIVRVVIGRTGNGYLTYH